MYFVLSLWIRGTSFTPFSPPALPKLSSRLAFYCCAQDACLGLEFCQPDVSNRCPYTPCICVCWETWLSEERGVCTRVCVCAFAEPAASSGGSSGAVSVNRSSWASTNPLARARALYYSSIFLSSTHKHSHSFTRISYLLTRRFTLAHSPLSPLCAGGPPSCFQEGAQTNLEFPLPRFEAPRWGKKKKKKK